MERGRLLLVEDEESLGYLLSEYLNLRHFDVTWVQDPHEVIPLLKVKEFQLLILDIMMPGKDGFELAEEIRGEFPEMPFLFLTARTMKLDALKAFSLGAVDYIRKPIDEEELLARIRAILKRIHWAGGVAPEEIALGRYRFDPQKQELRLGEEVQSLTTRESELLQFLAVKMNQVCTHRSILLGLWGENDYFKQKSLNVYITRIRKYLEKDPSIRIENVRGKGFVLRLDA